jgi:hypothetical protein
MVRMAPLRVEISRRCVRGATRVQGGGPLGADMRPAACQARRLLTHVISGVPWLAEAPPHTLAACPGQCLQPFRAIAVRDVDVAPTRVPSSGQQSTPSEARLTRPEGPPTPIPSRWAMRRGLRAIEARRVVALTGSDGQAG